MTITNDQAYKAALETGLLDKALGWEIADNTKLVVFGQRFYDLGAQRNIHPVDALKALGADMTPEAEAGLRDLCDTPVTVGQAAAYESRIEAQKAATESLQRQVEAEHTKVVKARMLLDMLCKIIPGDLLDPYAKGIDHQGVKLQQAVALARTFLEDTK